MSELDKNRLQDAAYMAQRIAACEAEIQKGIIGQHEVIREVMLAMLTGGNVLLEGMPGLGKTRLVSTIGKVFDLPFKRIQFTPDLMPSDVTGTNIIMKGEQGSSFSFVRGPIFANLILADEINRATPKTQSALLEAMQEHTVTVGSESHALDAPFFVLATQNPIENEGTYPLPEAQLDRFIMKISMGSMSADEERELIDRFITAQPLSEIGAVCTAEEIRQLQKECREVFVHDDLRGYIVSLVQATRKRQSAASAWQGVSPRGTLAFLRAAQGYALVEGRDYVVPEDIKTVAVPALCHRLIGELEEAQKRSLVDGLLNSVELPTEDWKR